MTVSTQTSKSQYTGNGVTTAFTGSFRILDQTHITVILTDLSGVDATQTLTTNYTVSGVGGATFTVTFVVAPTNGFGITIFRNVPLTQGLDLVLNDEFPSTEIENSFDKATMIDQQLKEAQDRSLKFPVSDAAGLATTLPTVTQRASKFLSFDASGQPSAAAGATALPVSTFMATVLDDLTAAAARTTLGSSATGDALFIAASASAARTALAAPGLADVNSYTAANRGAITALSDASTVTPDFASANNFSLTIGGARTLANPSNQTAGQSGAIVITQDGTGSRTLAYGSNYKFAGGTAPTLTTTASAVDVLVYYVESASRITATLINDVK